MADLQATSRFSEFDINSLITSELETQRKANMEKKCLGCSRRSSPSC